MKKSFLIFVLGGFLIPSLVACGGKGSSIDKTKTQLYVRYNAQGFAGSWTDEFKSAFETKYAEVSFETGKKGVQVIFDPGTKGDLLDDIKSAKGSATVFLSEGYSADYYLGATEADKPCANITELLNKPLNVSLGKDANGADIPAASDESATILSKFRETEKEAFFIKDGKGNTNIYAIPYMDASRGTITYDEDLFNQKSFFFDDNNEIGASKTNGDKLGLGPDGIANTADDGLPRTYDEFYTLCDTMCEKSVVPFTWDGNWLGYLQDFMLALRAQSMGSTEYTSLLHGEGTLYDYITTAPSDLKTATGSNKDFEADTFDLTYYTLSEYAPIEMMYRIVKNETLGDGRGRYYIGPVNFSGSYSQYLAQGDFLLTKSYNTCGKDVGMLIDGTWWWNESKNNVERYKTLTGKDAGTRNVKYMAMPKPNEFTWNQTKGENVVFSDEPSSICIKNNLNGYQKTLAELFVQYFCTNESLVRWNVSVNTPRALSYTLTTDEYNKLSAYGKSLYDVHSSSADKGYQTYKTIRNISDSSFYIANSLKFNLKNVFSNGDTNNWVTAKVFKNDTSNKITPASFFDSILKIHKNTGE